MYRTAILGCRGRSRGHVRAYEHVKRGQIVAICDAMEDLLNEFGDAHGIETRYTDLHEMLDKEKPDVLHIVTRPELRVPLLIIASEHQVPGVIVEKPIAIDSSAYLTLLELSRTTSTRIAVNHQLHFHPKRIELGRDVREGRIGEIQFLETSSRLNLLGQGTHVLELLFSFNGHVPPTSVFGQVSGGNALKSTHPAPDMAEAVISFEDGTRGLLQCGPNAPAVSGAGSSAHKRVAVYGTQGFVEWQMNAWQRNVDGKYESGAKSYGAEDVLGQARLTEAMFDWLEDEKAVHPTCIEHALQQYNVILGLYASSLDRRPIPLPYTPEGDFLDRLREACGS